MAEVRRVRAIWTGVAGTPYISTWWFENSIGSVGAIQSAVRTFLTALAPAISNTLSCTIEADQSVFNPANGDLIGVESQASGAVIPGTGSGTPLPPQDQFVLRLATGGIVNNRRVRGRFYVPGPTVTADVAGAPSSASITTLNTAAASLITNTASAGKWSVYSRPITAAEIRPGSDAVARDGSIHTVQAASAWSKFGMQRRRRD